MNTLLFNVGPQKTKQNCLRYDKKINKNKLLIQQKLEYWLCKILSKILGKFGCVFRPPFMKIAIIFYSISKIGETKWVEMMSSLSYLMTKPNSIHKYRYSIKYEA